MWDVERESYGSVLSCRSHHRGHEVAHWHLKADRLSPACYITEAVKVCEVCPSLWPSLRVWLVPLGSRDTVVLKVSTFSCLVCGVATLAFVSVCPKWNNKGNFLVTLPAFHEVRASPKPFAFMCPDLSLVFSTSAIVVFWGHFLLWSRLDLSHLVKRQVALRGTDLLVLEYLSLWLLCQWLEVLEVLSPLCGWELKLGEAIRWLRSDLVEVAYLYLTFVFNFEPIFLPHVGWDCPL
jgi:hypothetical protein